MSLAGCKINPIDVNFHLQKSSEIFAKKSAEKFWSKKDRVWKVSSLMPIRVNVPINHIYRIKCTKCVTLIVEAFLRK